MLKNRWGLGLAGMLALLTGCSSTPKVSTEKVSRTEASDWFRKYCSRGSRELSGDLVIRSNTREFKGQYPANIHFDKNGSFVLEITSILGGTLLRLTSDGKAFDVLVPPKEKYNRSHVTHYLGLDVPVLSQLLLGDLPCPLGKEQGTVKVEKNIMMIETPNWRWGFERAKQEEGGVPVRVTLLPSGVADPKLNIELLIEDWDREGNYAKKVTVKSPEGELHWSWRSRN